MSTDQSHGHTPAPLPPALAGTFVEEKRNRAMRLLVPRINKELGAPCQSYAYIISFELWHLSCGEGNEIDRKDLELVAEEYRKVGWKCEVGDGRDGLFINFEDPKQKR